MTNDPSPSLSVPRALGIPEITAATGVCRSTLYNLWARGEGPRRFHAGKRVLVTVEALREWIAAREAEAK